jgi:hypothetical protein
MCTDLDHDAADEELDGTELAREMFSPITGRRIVSDMMSLSSKAMTDLGRHDVRRAQT